MINIEEYLGVGIENALHQKELSNILGVNPTTVKEMVKVARKNGVEILSGAKGYWLAKDDEERREFIRRTTKQAITRFITSAPTKNALREIKGQISLEEILKDIIEEQECEQEHKKE